MVEKLEPQVATLHMPIKLRIVKCEIEWYGIFLYLKSKLKLGPENLTTEYATNYVFFG